MDNLKTPLSVIWFGNGVAAVFDDNGDQIPEFQGKHHETLEAFRKAGIDWTKIEFQLGAPKIHGITIFGCSVATGRPSR